MVKTCVLYTSHKIHLLLKFIEIDGISDNLISNQSISNQFKNLVRNVSVVTDEGLSPKLAPSEGGSREKYRKLAANVIRTWPLQSPSDDLSFVVT